MPFNGAGQFSVYTPGNPTVTGTTISSTVNNNTNTDFATGLSTALLKDGTQTATAKVPFVLGVTVGAASTYTGLQTFSNGIQLGSGSTLANYVAATTFTPTVTLVGGAGNTVPVYSTNTGRYTRIGDRVFVDIYLTGDGGAEGAGTGTLTLAIPIAIGASVPAGYIIGGRGINSTASYPLLLTLVGGASVITLGYFDTIASIAAFTGDLQNNATRSIRLQFNYEA